MPLIAPENVRWRLKQLYGGRIFDINATDNYMVGRNTTAQISLNSSKTSRTHSSFVVNVEGHLLVQDLKSINGTYVNGTQITVYVLCRLFPGDTIGFGIADMSLSEDDKDRQTFFVVIHDPPPIQDMPPVEASLEDSAIGSIQSSVRNSTSEIKTNSHCGFLELQPSSDEKIIPLEVIDLSSSSEEEKPDVDLDDCFEEHENIPYLKIVDVRSVPEPSPEKKSSNSNNLLQKLPSSTKSTKDRRFSDDRNIITVQQVTNFFGTSDSENRIAGRKPHSAYLNKEDKEGLRSMVKSNCADNSIKESYLQKSTENPEKNVGGNSINSISNTSHKSESYEIDNISKENLAVQQKEKGLDDQRKNKEEKKTTAIGNSISSRRKSKSVLNIERKEENSECPRQRSKSIAVESSSIQKKAKSNLIADNCSIKEPASIPLRRKTLSVSSHERKDNATRRNTISGESSCFQNDISEMKSRSNEKSKVKEFAGTSLGKKIPEVLYPIKKSAQIEINSFNPRQDRFPEEEPKRRNKERTAMTSKKKIVKEPAGPKCNSLRKSIVDDLPNQTKETCTKISKQTKVDNGKNQGAKLSLRKSSVGGAEDPGNKIRSKKQLGDKNSEKHMIADDLMLELDKAIYGKDETAETSKKKEPNEERGAKTPPLHKHKKVKIDDCEEFSFGSTRVKEPRKHLLVKIEDSINSKNTKNFNSSKDLTVNEYPGEKKITKEIKVDSKSHNESVTDAGCKCYEPDTSEGQKACPVHVASSSIRNMSSENHDGYDESYSSYNKSFEKTFTTDKDNSVIIDITDEDADDFSCSQIFHMSEIVKSETRDETFQKIKNELAEMDFCEEEIIINPVPINLENDMSGFENTQDICACLEEGVEDNRNNDNFISNEENQELLEILGELDKKPGNKDNPDAEHMDVSLDESSVSPKNNQNDPASSKDKTYEKISCGKFFGKPQYVKPPVVEPHIIQKQKKDPSKKLPVTQNATESKSNKRKNSLETPTNKKKIKGSKSNAEPARCDSKSIQMEFKKRSSGSKADLDNSKLLKDSIREERRKKLKEISERQTPPKPSGSKCSKGGTVKVLPESKTLRGSFLCQELKKNSDGTVKSKINKNISGVTDLVGNKQTTNIKERNSNLVCRCHDPGRQVKCLVHTSGNRSPSGVIPNRSFDTNDERPGFKQPNQRPLTPSKGSIKNCLKSPDTLERTSLSSTYNLRRTKSSGDLKEGLRATNDQVRPTQSRYNLRHSTALDSNQNKVIQNNVDLLRQNNKVDLRTSYVSPAYPVNSTLRPHVNQRPQQYALPYQINNTLQAAAYNAASRASHDLSRSLMWSNGGPSIPRRSPAKRLPGVDEVIQKMVHWLPNWLLEQVSVDCSAPINSPPARKIPPNFENFDQYYETFSKLVLLENWQYLFKGFREGAEQTKKVRIDHFRVTNDLVSLDCTCYITQRELKQGLFYKMEDFVLFEYVVNDKDNSYLSLNFGYIERCKKSTISNNDIISIRPCADYVSAAAPQLNLPLPRQCNALDALDVATLPKCKSIAGTSKEVGSFCDGEPHTKVEFTLVTRYQPSKEINMKKFPIIKLLANVRAHLMLVKAIKMLVNSPICSKILHPKINEFKFAVIHRDIIQPHTLNTQQRSIVLEAASLCTGYDPGIYCIKGPPGTGKSTVIVHLVFQIIFSHYVTKKTQKPPMILLAAPSNTAVDNLLSKLTSFKHSLGPEWDRYKAQIKCVRIGPEASIKKELLGYSLPKLAEKHIPVKHMEVPEFRAARERNDNLIEFSKHFFGDRYGYEIKSCEDLIIQKSNIICTTLNSCINGKLIEAVNRGLIKFSCCIIDEATQCHEVESLLPTILGIDKFVLVGDPKQLNATIMNRDAFKLGFGESLFSRISSNFTNDPRTPIRMLTDQYRMHPEICAFPNKHFYEGKLRSLAKPPNKLPEKIKPYLVFNCDKFRDSDDYTNIDEVNLIKVLLNTLFGMIDRSHKYTVGIISPYNAQKDLINSHIGNLALKISNCKITVNTVDSFQGSENDIIIISCVRDSTNSFLQNEHRLNVALTRAKQALYIIGNYTLFKECRPLYDLREDAKRRRLLLDIRQDPLTISNFSKYLIKSSND